MARNKGTFGPENPPPGRRKGSRNKKKLIAEEYAQAFLSGEKVKTAMQTVLENPNDPKWEWATELMYHYAYGKPVERSEVHQDIDQHTTVTQLVDFREFFAQHAKEATNGHHADTPV